MGEALVSIGLAICNAGINAGFRARIQGNKSSEMTILGSHLFFDKFTY